MEQQLLLWGGFLVFVVAMLALDLGVFHRKAHVIHMREALTWTAVWIGLALTFNVGVAYFWGAQAGLEFLTGYLVEKSLSMDNVFVFLLIFNYFKTPASYQHKVLFWGIVGAILARSVFIVAGLALLEAVHWTMYIFGAFLLGTGVWMMVKKQEQYNPERNPLIRFVRRRARITERYEGNRFFVRKDGLLYATPLFIVLLAVESSDIVFAIDSIPAIFSITRDHFIVYSSNIFAMLGLRAMYFAVAGFMRSFHYLHYGFASIIVILGVKMLLTDVYHVPVALSLGLIVMILIVGVMASVLRPRREDVKRLLARFERRRLISFRRLLLLENVFDLGSQQVGSAMQRRENVKVLRADAPWEDNRRVLIDSRYSRYPVLQGNGPEPLGIVHVKDLLYHDTHPSTPEEWIRVARPYHSTQENAPLDDLLMELQQQRVQVAVVFNGDTRWTGMITLEDVIEEIVGQIGDEFEASQPELPALTPSRVVLGLEADSFGDAIRATLAVLPASELPEPREEMLRLLLERERARSMYLGNGVVAPNALLASIEKPVLVFARFESGVPLPTGHERATLFFILLIPVGLARGRRALLQSIASLSESDYVRERLAAASTSSEVIATVAEATPVAVG